MRSVFLMISQGLHFSDQLKRLEYSSSRYGQLFIYLFAIGVIGYLYISMVGMFATYLDGLELSQIPE